MTADRPFDLRLLEGHEAWRLAEQLEDRLLSPSTTGWETDGLMGIGAFEKDRLLGAAGARLKPDDASPVRVTGERWHVAHLALAPAASEHELSEQLMLAQREQALGLGLQLMTWSLDPLDLRLARLSVRRLGAVSRWIRSAAGSSQPALEIEWWIRSPRVGAWLKGTRPRLELVDALEAGAPKLNAGALREDDLLSPAEAEFAPEGAMALLEIPPSFRELQQRDVSLARAWREQIERLLTQAFERGYWLTDLLELRGERHPRAYYLLIDGERTLS